MRTRRRFLGGSHNFLTPRISLPPQLAKIKCGLFTQESDDDGNATFHELERVDEMSKDSSLAFRTFQVERSSVRLRDGP